MHRCAPNACHFINTTTENVTTSLLMEKGMHFSTREVEIDPQLFSEWLSKPKNGLGTATSNFCLQLANISWRYTMYIICNNA